MARGTCPECGSKLVDQSADAEVCPACTIRLAIEVGGADGDSTLAETAAELRPDERIGPYRIVGQIGEGGMGIVYLADQEQPVRRRVALKVIKAGMDTRQVVARFESERQSLAVMNHPNVATVLDAGSTSAGRPYFVMEFVEGAPITRYCDENRLTTTERLRLFVEVCRGVQHAHQKGIIHRDIKPSNVLVERRDGVAVPKIIDFGVAKATHRHLVEGTIFTHLGQVIGTPEYMSPEQAGLTVADVDTRTDVYSLGVLLYELLIGALPFDSITLRRAAYEEICRRIKEDLPAKPSTRIRSLGAATIEVAARRRTDPDALQRVLRGDLDWVTMKALEKERARRYDTPSDLAADIERYLDHRPVAAGPPSRSYLARKFVRRHRGPVTAAALLLLSVLVGAAISVAWARQAERERALRNAQLIESSVATGMGLAGAGDLFNALPWLTRALALEEGSGESERAHRIRLGMTLDKLPRLLQMWFHNGSVDSLAFSPDGRALISAGSDRTARILETVSGAERQRLEHDGAVRDARFSADGRLAVTATDAGAIAVWDARSGQPVRRLELGCAADVAAVDPTGTVVAAAGRGALSIWRLDDGSLVRSIEISEAGLDRKSLAFAADGSLLAVGDQMGEIAIVSLPDGAVTAVESLPDASAALSVDVHPVDRTVAVSSIDWMVRFYEPSSGRPSGEPLRLNQPVNSVRFTADGRRFVTAGSDQTVRVFLYEGRREYFKEDVDEFPGEATLAPDPTRYLLHTNNSAQLRRAGHIEGAPIRHGGSTPTRALLSPDGQQIATAGGDGTVRLWSVPPMDAGSTLLPHAFYNHGATYSADGARLVSASGFWRAIGGYPAHGYAQVWDVVGHRPLTPPMRHARTVYEVQLSPDERHLAAISGDGVVRVWDAGSGEPVSPPFRHGIEAQGVLYLGQERPLLTWVGPRPIDDPGAPVISWDPRRGEAVFEMTAHVGRVNAVVADPEGERVASAGIDGTVRVWEPATGQELIEPLEHGVPVLALAFSPDGAVIATSAADRMVRFWSSVDGRRLEPSLLAASPSESLLFTPDGERLVVGAPDGNVGIWDWRAARAVSAGLSHPILFSERLSNDGRWLSTSTSEGRARLWDAGNGQELSPPLEHSGSGVFEALFSPDSRVVAVSEAGGVRLWPMRSTDAAPDDLERLALVLGGQRLLGARGLVAMPVDELRAAWDDLRARHPEWFRLSEAEQASRARALAESFAGSARWAQAEAQLTRVVALRAASPIDLIARGDANAELGRWDGAVADHRTALASNPDSAMWQLRVALLELRRGNQAQHASICDELLDRWGETANPDRADRLVRTCALAPAVATRHAARLTALSRVRPEIEPGRADLVELQALAEYRAGKSGEAQTTIDRRLAMETSVASGSPSERGVRALAALVAVARGQRESARRHLAAAHDASVRRLRWPERLHAELLLTEAKSRVE